MKWQTLCTYFYVVLFIRDRGKTLKSKIQDCLGKCHRHGENENLRHVFIFVQELLSAKSDI